MNMKWLTTEGILYRILITGNNARPSDWKYDSLAVFANSQKRISVVNDKKNANNSEMVDTWN